MFLIFNLYIGFANSHLLSSIKVHQLFFWKVEAFNFHFYMLHIDNLKREDYKNQSRDKFKKMHNIKTVLKFWNTKETNYMLVNRQGFYLFQNR